MKTVYRISIILNILFAGYILIRGSELLIKEYLLKTSYSQEQETAEQQLYSETVSSGEHINCDTIYMISEYDIATGKQEVYQELLPESFVGMNRVQLLEWMDEYNLHASLEDKEQGFVSMELLTFSQKEVRVRKRVDSMQESISIEPIEQPQQLNLAEDIGTVVSQNSVCYGCILVQDGLLTVYDSQRRHVILYTDISLVDLPPEQQEEILSGKEVYSEQEMYNLLESYSS